MVLKAYFDLLSTYLKPQWPRVLLLAILLFASIGLQLVNPQIIRYVLDTAEAGGGFAQIGLAALLFILFGLAQAGAAFATTYVGENVSWTATNALRADLTLRCLRLDMGFHNARTPGELIERIDGDASELANFFSQLVLKVLGNGLLVVGILVLLFREDWRMGTAAAIFVTITLAALQAMQNRTVQAWSGERAASANLFGFIEERLAGTEDIRANGGEPYVLRRLMLLRRALFERYRRAYFTGVTTFSITHMIFVFGGVLGLGVGAWLYLNGQITIGTVYLILYYLTLLQGPLEEVREEVRNLQQATASIGRVRELLALQPAIVETVQEALPPGSLAVQFDQVSFSYRPPEPGADENGEPRRAERVLHDLNFQLAAGKVLGLLGRTGSGKTTLTRLLFRLYDPTHGAICLGGTNIRNVGLSDLRQRVGMITQEVQLFQASLRDNITLFKRDVDDEQILAVLRELGLWSWYSAQPDGLDTRLGAGGVGLSAGEAQLLAFVRVFLKDPGLVILDEASSRLDPATEQLLERAIDGLLSGGHGARTGIIIAHRLPTVQRADEIMILAQGRIVEHGVRIVLANDPTSHFHRLLQTGLEEELA
jgi:ATP-binding cassette subfamily B protein